MIEAEPFSGADEIISLMSSEYIFSKFDMTKGYYQFALIPEYKHLTALSTTTEMYEFNHIAFGLVNALAEFVRKTRALSHDISNVMTHIDKMCIYSEIFDDHTTTMANVFQKLIDNGLFVTPSNIKIAYP